MAFHVGQYNFSGRDICSVPNHGTRKRKKKFRIREALNLLCPDRSKVKNVMRYLIEQNNLQKVLSSLSHLLLVTGESEDEQKPVLGSAHYLEEVMLGHIVHEVEQRLLPPPHIHHCGTLQLLQGSSVYPHDPACEEPTFMSPTPIFLPILRIPSAS